MGGGREPFLEPLPEGCWMFRGNPTILIEMQALHLAPVNTLGRGESVEHLFLGGRAGEDDSSTTLGTDGTLEDLGRLFPGGTTGTLGGIFHCYSPIWQKAIVADQSFSNLRHLQALATVAVERGVGQGEPALVRGETHLGSRLERRCPAERATLQGSRSWVWPPQGPR